MWPRLRIHVLVTAALSRDLRVDVLGGKPKRREFARRREGVLPRRRCYSHVVSISNYRNGNGGAKFPKKFHLAVDCFSRISIGSPGGKLGPGGNRAWGENPRESGFCQKFDRVGCVVRVLASSSKGAESRWAQSRCKEKTRRERSLIF